VDAQVVTHLPNVRYLCGFSGSAGFLLVEEHRATLFTDSRYALQASEETARSGVHVRIAKRGLLRALVDALNSRKGRLRTAYSSEHMTVQQMKTLSRGLGKRGKWMDCRSNVEKLRSIKDADEIATMRDAAVLISDVFYSVAKRIKPGMTELSLAAEIDYAMKQQGASRPSFETIIASGPRSAWIHARPSSKPLKKNELVVMDQGAILRGYSSDLTRTVFLGRPSGKVRGIYNSVLEAQRAAKEAIRPGVRTGAVDLAARRVLRQRGLEKYFTHSTGHGLGIEVHEMPRLASGDETLLAEGMVVTVEPGVYVEGFGGVRIEDDVLVTARGAEDLTTAPRELLAL
jgi:Xaa-Pro aminopeptidase